MKKFALTLQNRLALTYTLFISLALILLTITINIFTGLMFTALVKRNIADKSAEIVRALGGQYNPMSQRFDTASVEAMGMYFVHEGYIITVEDERGDPVWDARSCNMRECMTVINRIAGRMEEGFGVNGQPRLEQYPVKHRDRTVGTITIETYGPFFYSETEAAFLTSINRLLIAATVIVTFFTALISALLSRAIARPVNKSAEAARQIARAHSGKAGGTPRTIRVDDRYRTRELAGLARSVNELAAQLEEGERRQKRLTSDIAHELRTPLTCLQGDMEAMIDGVYKPDKEHLESCHEEIIRLAGLVKDLHTLTNLEWEQISLNKTEFDLAALLRVTAEQFRAAALEKGITIQLDLVESPITADYDRLKQVFINLLSNAVTYTGQGGITIQVTRTPPPGAAWEAAIADTGIGIPGDDLPHIFERFYRADKSRSRGTGGAGIGLTIAAAIIHAHGGTITAEANTSESRGSVFRVAVSNGISN
jgi:signal transduction histidine kinase